MTALKVFEFQILQKLKISGMSILREETSHLITKAIRVLNYSELNT